MRVAQKFAGYSLAEADNLRKACGKKIRELIAKERAEVRRRVRAHRLRGGARQAAVRHHRAVRRLRLQQVPRLRLRVCRLPDRLSQGALPGRVPRLPAHQRQEQPRQGGRLPRRVPGDGHPGADARRQPVGDELRRPVAREVPDDVVAARRHRPAPSRSGCRPCATWARASSSCSSTSATQRPLRRLLRLRRPGPEPVLNKRTIESLIKAGAFDSLGHPRQGLLGVFEQIIDHTLDRRREANAA